MGQAHNNGAADLLRRGSLEMTGRDGSALREAAPALPAGLRVNLTFLQNEDLELRLEAARTIRELGFTPVPHLAARRIASEAELRAYLEGLATAGANEHVFLVGGDPATPAGPYPDALSIIRSGLLQEYGVTSAGITGYPEGHPDIADDVLASALTDKLAALGEAGLETSVITQFSFDAAAVAEWVGRLRAAGVTVPVRLGVPGPAGIKRLLGFAKRLGIRNNATMIRKYGLNVAQLLGNSTPDRFLEALAQELAGVEAGGTSVHLYTFGGLEASARWRREYLGEAA